MIWECLLISKKSGAQQSGFPALRFATVPSTRQLCTDYLPIGRSASYPSLKKNEPLFKLVDILNIDAKKSNCTSTFPYNKSIGYGTKRRQKSYINEPIINYFIEKPSQIIEISRL